MRAIVHTEFGNPAEVLHVEDRPIPEPGPGQVRVKVTLAPIHNHDLSTVRGTYGFRPQLPAPAGTEIVGLIDALGANVAHLRPGQRVVSGTHFGVWADYAVVDAAEVIPVPDQLDDATAAQLVAMPFSAVTLLDFLNVEPGQWIVVNSANGTIGRLLSQLAAARGVNVVGLVRRDAATQGLDRVVSTQQEDWREQVAAITGGADIVAGVESVGGPAANQVLKLLAPGATLVTFGAMSEKHMELSAGTIIFKDITVRGFWGKRVAEQMPQDKKMALIGEVIQRVAEGSVTLPVDQTFAADDVQEAVRASLAPGRSGKVLLRFSCGDGEGGGMTVTPAYPRR